VPRIPRIGELLPSASRALSRFALAGILPIASFYVAFRIGGPVPGIACGMGFSLLALLIQLRRLGRLDPVVLVPMALILIQGTAALLTGSVDLYLAVPAAENVIWGILLVGSVIVRRPLVRIIAGELQLIPEAFANSPTLRNALAHVTLAWGVAAFIKAGARLWMLSVLSLEPFLVGVTVLHLIVNGALLGFSFWWPLRATRSARAEQPA
jgi:intracellular septation protein